MFHSCNWGNDYDFRENKNHPNVLLDKPFISAPDRSYSLELSELQVPVESEEYCSSRISWLTFLTVPCASFHPPPFSSVWAARLPVSPLAPTFSFLYLKFLPILIRTFDHRSVKEQVVLRLLSESSSHINNPARTTRNTS